MKYIISTTGSEINFLLSRERNLVIDTTMPIQVEDHEFSILENRLGRQIQSVVMADSSDKVEETPVVETTPEVEKTEEVIETKDVESTPIVEDEE